MKAIRIVIGLVIFAMVICAQNSSIAGNHWTDNELDDIMDIDTHTGDGGTEKILVIPVVDYPTISPTEMLLSQTFTNDEGLQLAIPVWEDIVTQETVIPLVVGADLTCYIPLTTPGEVLEMDAGFYFNLHIIPDENGTLHLQLRDGLWLAQFIDVMLPMIQYPPEYPTSYVTPILEEVDGYDYVIPLVWQLKLCRFSTIINLWDLEFDDYRAFDYSISEIQPI